MTFHKDDQVLAIGDRTGNVTMVGVPEARKLATFQGSSPIMGIEFMPDGRRVLVASLDEPIRVMDLAMLGRCVTGNREAWAQPRKPLAK
jgi:hypothetical protein